MAAGIPRMRPPPPPPSPAAFSVAFHVNSTVERDHASQCVRACACVRTRVYEAEPVGVMSRRCRLIPPAGVHISFFSHAKEDIITAIIIIIISIVVVVVDFL